MKTKQCVIIFLFFASLTANAQEKKSITDKAFFEKIISTSNDQNLILSSLDSLIKKELNKTKVAEYYEQYVATAIKIEAFDKALKNALAAYRFMIVELYERDRAYNIVLKVEKYQENIEAPTLKGTMYHYLGSYHTNGGDLNKAIDFLTKAIDTYNPTDDGKIARSFLFRGNSYFEMSNYFSALEDYKKSNTLYKKIGDKKYYYQTLSNISTIYGELGLFEKEIEEIQKIISEKLSTKSTENLHLIYYNLAMAYNRSNQFEECKKNAFIALDYGKKENNKRVLGWIYGTLCEVFLEENNLKKAKYYLELNEEIVKEIKQNTSSSRFYREKAKYLIKVNKLDEALNLVQQSLQNDKKMNDTRSIMYSHKFLFEIYKKMNNATKSLDNYASHIRIKDSLVNIKNTQVLIYYQTLYETEIKEKEIITQQKDIEILDNKNTAKQRLLLFGGLGLISSFLIIILYRKRKQLKKDKQLQEVYSQQLLVSQEKDRQRIAKDLHDGLGHSLMIVKSKLSQNKDTDTADLLGNAIEEMRTISRVLHPYQLEDIGLTQALQNLILQLDENYKDTYIFGEIEDIEMKVTPIQSLNIFRIVQECLSNVIKHANAISAEVSLYLKNDTIHLDIRDNGKGFDFSEKYTDFKTMGLKTIQERVKFLKGTIDIKSNTNKGTLFSIKFSA